MRKIVLISGVLFALALVVDSCTPKRGLPRPQGRPTPPSKFTQVEKPVDTQHTIAIFG